MFRQNSKSLWHFNRGERIGVLTLVVAILVLLCFIHFVKISKPNNFDVSSPEIVTLQAEMDSLRCLILEDRKPKIYPFNPNFITDYKAYALGITSIEYDRLVAFRKKGNWINSTSDFKKVTQVPDSILQKISPYFKFPDWVKYPKKSYTKSSFSKKEKYTGKKVDLNQATKEQLREVSGIGEVLSERIIKKRKELNGFSHELQLYSVWGLKTEVVERTLLRFEVKNPKVIDKMNINKVSASDLSTIPGISFGLAKKIWEYVYLREGISDFEELTKIEELTPQKLQLIQLYLLIE